MKILIQKKLFLDELKLAEGSTDSSGEPAWLRNVLFTAKGSGDEGLLYLAATDMSIGLMSKMRTFVQEPGSVSIPAKAILERVNAMQDGDLWVETSESDQVRLTHQNFPRGFIFAGLPASEHGRIAMPLSGAQWISIHQDQLRTMIERTRFAMSQNVGLPSINGSLFAWNGSAVRMTSTDGHRMAKAQTHVGGVSSAQQMLLSRRSIEHLRSVIADANEPVAFAVQGNDVFFKVGTRRIFSCRLASAQFPAIESMPLPVSERVTVLRDSLLDAIKGVMVALDANSQAAYVTFTGSKIEIQGESATSGDAFDSAELEKEVVTPVRVGLNLPYMVDALTAMNTERVQIQPGDGVGPVLFFEDPSEQLNLSPDELYISMQMPMIIAPKALTTKKAA
jgi:DNA polymerase-3 subunit beta